MNEAVLLTVAWSGLWGSQVADRAFFLKSNLVDPQMGQTGSKMF